MKPKTDLLFISVLAIWIGWGCKKETAPPDYRDAFTGPYAFEVKAYEWNAGQGITNQTQDSTSGEVYYKKGNLYQKMIQVRYRESTETTLKVDSLGNLSLLCNTPAGKIDLADQTIDISWTSNSCPGGALGGGYGIKLKGQKK